MSRCRFVEDHRADYPIVKLCALAEIPRSVYYRFRDPTPSDRILADHALLEPIVEIYERSHRTYGRIRITGQLVERRGMLVNHKRVQRLMREHGLVGVQRRKKAAKRVDHGSAVFAPDLLQRDFTASRPDQRWVADITEFNTHEGRLYLAAIKDLYSNAIVGWSTAPRRTAELVVDALVAAITRRQPAGEVTHHADHGSQYTSMRFADAAADARVALSFGSIGDAYDNAAMESFFATLKTELEHIHGPKNWPDHATLRAALFDYIEIFYNRSRHQARLRHRTPAEVQTATETVDSEAAVA